MSSYFEQIFGLEKSVFFSKYWETSLLQAKSKNLKTLVGSLGLDFLLSINSKGVECGDFMVIRNGFYCRKSVYMESGRASLALLRQLYEEEQATLYLRQVEKYDPGLRAICRALDDELYPATVNACLFLSNSQQRAFGAHFDTHDALIVQVEGSKRWQIWPSIVNEVASMEAPKHYTNRVEKIVAHTPPVYDKVLHEGDVLYMPRCTIHRVLSVGTHSSHLNFWLKPKPLTNFLGAKNEH
ncbi:hypothetical protein TX23_21560 [Pseudomonas paralactis]|uniref:JmjC domain-containing protein n=1 Tax=Pseudomonas paralactis TaxID=1615673 RepID=A0A0R3A9J1_9PSED|nr:cupin domain-containing protein [Pseudomonas paralactis]KRP69957.1 hypothetical protein TX23_21560 [Pseudomonas paralactis]